jgi:hypothetical protein
MQGGTPGTPGAPPPDLIMGIRTGVEAFQKVGQMNPALMPFVQQISQLARQMLVQAANVSSMQTPSGQAVPTAGM